MRGLSILWYRRSFLFLLLLGLALLGTGTIAHIMAYPNAFAQIEEEEEEEKKPDPKKPPIIEEEEGEKEEPTGARPIRHIDVDDPPTDTTKIDIPQVVDLKKAARTSRHDGIKQLFQDLAIPHDVMKYQSVNGPAYRRIAPIAPYIGDNPKRLKSDIQIMIMDQEWNVVKKTLTSPSNMKEVKHYEELAQDRVTKFLAEPFERFAKNHKLYLSPVEKLIAAEQALIAVSRYHTNARARERRRGDEWIDVEEKLRKSLLHVVIERLKLSVEKEDWDTAFALAKQTAERFPLADDQREIAKPMTKLVEGLLALGLNNDEKLREAHNRLKALQEEFPNSKALMPVTDRLRRLALNRFQEAKNLVEDNQLDRARELLKQAEEYWPHLPGLRDYRLKIDKAYPILNVGVKKLPLHLSPAMAWEDSEKQALELLFESLVELSPDPKTVRYRSELAQGRPRMIYLGRKFKMATNAFWSNGDPVTALDVSNTVGMLQQRDWRGYNPSWAVDLLKEARVSNPYELSLTLRQGYIDPLSLMTFKILPTGVASPDEVSFAEQPIGSGPYQFVPGDHEINAKPFAKFIANPHYGRRPDKFGKPRIREIRFFASQLPLKEMQKGDLDLILNLDPADVDKAKVMGKVFVPNALPTRRIYFLAINHRSQFLNNPNLRRALAYAIPRDAILTEHFREGLKEAHKPLNGPYPVGSWAYNAKLKSDPFDANAARAQLQIATKKHPGILTKAWELKYPAEDERIAEAMKAIKEKIHETLGINLALKSTESRSLRTDIHNKHDYDLAYYYHDYSDDTYWLRPLLDPRATGVKGMNYLGYTSGRMEQDLREAMSHRNFAKVREITHDIHRRFDQEMPFVPLWQLDRFIAIHRSLQIYDDAKAIDYSNAEAFPIDAQRILATAQHWILNRR